MRGLIRAALAIQKARTIAISCHINPDGDSIGSLLALGLGCMSLGKRVVMLSADGVPKQYRHLPGAEHIKKKILRRVDLAISVDCNTKEMIGDNFRVLKKAGEFIEIDHHPMRSAYGSIQLIDTHAAAVGELVYLLLKRLHLHITKAIALNILTSIIVETNSFRLPQVRSLTFLVCSEMLKKNVDFHILTETVYWIKSRETALLTGIGLSRCQFLCQGALVWSFVKMQDMKKTKGRKEDLDALADEMRAIRGVDVAVLFREQSRVLIRVSLRSKAGFNVAKIAREFNGGGHSDVAGCFIPNRKECITKLLQRAVEVYRGG